MILGILLAAADVVPSAAPAILALNITVPKSEIVVAEPVKVIATWSSLALIDVRTRGAKVFVDQGEGFKLWGEAAVVDGTIIGPPERLVPGVPQRTTHVVAVSGPTRSGAGFGLAFGTPGIYRVKVRYTLGAGVVESNTAMITVRAPQGSEIELVQRLRAEPETLIARQLTFGRRDRLEELFAAHPGAPHLARAQIIYLEKLLYEALGSAPDPVPPDAPVEGDVAPLLERLATLDVGDSPFDEERLLVLAEMFGRSHRVAQSRATYRQLMERYPRGEAATLARERLGIDRPKPGS